MAGCYFGFPMRALRPCCALLVALAGCGDPTHRLEPEMPTAQGMQGEALQIRFTLVDEDGAAVANTEVSFALEGAPADTSIRPDTATSDSRGGVVCVVTLGAEGTFDVVASAEGALDGSVSVTSGERAPAYVDCENDSTCSPSETCQLVTTGGTFGRMCTRSCTDESDCPTRGEMGSACVSAGSGPVCLQRCTQEPDCVTGNSCSDYMAREGMVRVCLPNN